MKIKVATAEDNKLLADSIREKLGLFPDDIEFKYRAVNGVDLLKKLNADSSVDTILMDIEMPEMDGIEATHQVSRLFPQIKIIMLTVFDDEDKIFRSIQAGAMGYLLKDETPDTICNGIKEIMEGGAPMSPTIAAKSLALLRNPNKLIQEENQEDYDLTKREIEVLAKLSQGLDYLEISEVLFISPFTVRKHIENIYRKLQVHNKMTAVKKAIQHKII
ncbi:MAG: response regulator transcription factor [Ignavibacteriaceae bacterium]|nr:response regulator transcription factor [Ignavibacteriaceae bacterium]